MLWDSLRPDLFSVAANSQRDPVSQNHLFIQVDQKTCLSMILTNGLRAGQTSSNGDNKSGCRLYLNVEKCGEKIQ